jgi:hypothetical protein
MSLLTTRQHQILLGSFQAMIMNMPPIAAASNVPGIMGSKAWNLSAPEASITLPPAIVSKSQDPFMLP